MKKCESKRLTPSTTPHSKSTKTVLRDEFVILFLVICCFKLPMKRVLVIEDDDDIAELTSIHLQDLGCQVTPARTGENGYQMSIQHSFDLIVLDIMLPGMDGLEVCRKLRAAEISCPILMLTAKSEEIDKVLGLETGADDYLTKPFSIREFLARVKAIFRRSGLNAVLPDSQANMIKIEDLIIDQQKRKIIVAGNRV